jgi:hypothetical protein
MKCLKCGVELDSSYDIPLCRNCEREQGGTVFKLSNPSEVLELHINSQKEHGNLPKDFELSDEARTQVKIMIYKLLELGEGSSQVVTNAIIGYCSGYLRGKTEGKSERI